ncbi:MAG: 50S ribosomal protein L29 [Helicobacter sp.]|nr:50S ribosomal protein L29 [Helicobacter sp.]
MKYTDLKDKNLTELINELKQKKLEIFELRLKLKTMQLTKTSEISQVKKDIARISTAITAKKRLDLIDKGQQ